MGGPGDRGVGQSTDWVGGDHLVHVIARRFFAGCCHSVKPMVNATIQVMAALGHCLR